MHNRKRDSTEYIYVILHSLHTSVLNPRSPYLKNLIIFKSKYFIFKSDYTKPERNYNEF